MKEAFSLACADHPDVTLRLIGVGDLENLRVWKNANRQSFFYQQVITPAAQQDWFRAYSEREDDFMFVICNGKHDIGCMGIRLRDGVWDIYNVILGDENFGGKGLMSRAIAMMCSFALANRSVAVTAKVLKSNPALRWYLRNGFRESADCGDHVVIELDRREFPKCRVDRVE